MKIRKQAYTIEFKGRAVKRIQDGQSVGMICKELGLSRNWVKAAAEGKLNGADCRVVTPEEPELSKRRAENLRLKQGNGMGVTLTLMPLDRYLLGRCFPIG
jgi:transposase